MKAGASTPWWRQFCWPKAATVIASTLLTVGLGVVDYLTGRDVHISPYYLLPICWVSWVVGRRAGLIVSVISAAMWLVADVNTDHVYPHPAIAYWNALTFLLLFAVVVWLLTAFHDSQLHLEDTVSQRTAALREEIAERNRLEAAKLQAERLAVVGTMAAGVAHEIRNPLGSIALNLDLVRKEISNLAETSRHESDEARTLVSEMHAELRRIQHVLEDYLQFARLPKPQREPLELNDWLSQKLDFMHGEFMEAKVTLHTRFDPMLQTVSADASQLWQAALNLIRNAVEAMPDGGELTISTCREGREARLRVADTGRGMSVDQFRQIFVPFFSTKARGTGLGLALVQQIITEHGGHVECDSTVGKGSAFTLFLPIAANS